MATDGETLQVLAAEDNTVNQMVLTGLLGNARPDYEVTLVEDGAQAIEAWRTGRFGLILMDVRMPGVDGRMATEAIRKEEAETGRSPIAIVALTAEALSDEIEACYASGMDAHVSKPFEVETLLSAIDHALSIRVATD